MNRVAGKVRRRRREKESGVERRNDEGQENMDNKGRGDKEFLFSFELICTTKKSLKAMASRLGI